MESINCPVNQSSPNTCLPPGFRFHPTDEELITYYLARKVANESFGDHAITEVDLNKHEPWDLPERAHIMGEKQWYFFSQKDRKYPSGSRTNRATQAGYWKATGKDKEIFMKSTATCLNGRKQLVGMKKTLVFYEGRAPRGLKSNWVMHEYRIHERASVASILGNGCSKLQGISKEDWILCRVFHKKLRQSKREYMKCNDAMNEAELLARFLLTDDQQLSQSPLNLAVSPVSLAGTENVASTAKWGGCPSLQSSETSTSSELPTTHYSLAHDRYSSFATSGGVSHSGLPFRSRASYDTPLARFPSDLESFWLHASGFSS